MIYKLLFRYFWKSYGPKVSRGSIVEIPYVPQSRHRLYLEKFCRKLTFCWWLWHSYGTRSPLKNIRARGRIIFLFFPRAALARAEIVFQNFSQKFFKDSTRRRSAINLVRNKLKSIAGKSLLRTRFIAPNLSSSSQQPTLLWISYLRAQKIDLRFQ